MDSKVKVVHDKASSQITSEEYRKTKVGRRPKDWKVHRVGEILNRIAKPVDVEPTQLYREIGIRSHGKGIFHKKETTGSKLGDKSVFWIEPNCLILNIVFAWELAVAKTSNNECGFIASHRFPMYKPENDIDLDYILYFFTSKQGENILKLASPGGAGRNKTLSQKDFFGSEVILPNINEQQKIAKILSTWEKGVELKEKLIEEKKKQLKGLMQNLLTGKIRWFDSQKYSEAEIKQRIEMIGKGKIPEGYRSTREGIIPIEWKIKKLKDICERVSSKNDGSAHPVLTISSLTGFLNQSDRFNKVIAGENISKYILLNKNEFAYNKGNSKTYPYGCVFRLEEYETALVPNVYYCFNIKEGLSEFFKHYFIAGKLNKQLARVVNTGVRNNGLLNLNESDFFSAPILFPPIDEQEKIANILTVAGKEVQYLEQELESLKQQKKGLMQLLLTGKVRVKC